MEIVTDTQPETNIETGLTVLDARETSLRELADKYKGLTIAGIDDKEGYKKVHEARMLLKAERVQVKKDGEALRQNAVKFQKRVIERVNDLTALIAPVEIALESEEARIDEEKEEIRKQIEMMEARVLQDRLNALNAFGFSHDWTEVKHMSDDQFEELVAHARAEHEEGLKRVAEEKAEQYRLRKEEEIRLQNEREELAKQRAEAEAMANELRLERERIENERLVIRKQEEERQAILKAEQDRIAKDQAFREAALRAEADKIAADKKAFEDQKQREIEIKEAEERARIEEQNRIKREEEQKTERERLAKLEAERQEALKPDKEKLLVYANHLSSLPVPILNDPECCEVLGCAIEKLKVVENYIKAQVENL